MSWFIHGRLGHFLCDEAGEGGEPGGGATPPAATTPGSVLANAAPNDWIPEKHRTIKEDGSLDLEASSRKVADAYRQLETRLGSGDAPPKTAEEYALKIEVDGFDWEEFKADPNSQAFLKGAHAKGMTNAQVEFAIGEYLKAAPGLIAGNAQLSQEDCVAQLKGVWADDKAYTANLQSSHRAAQGFANAEGLGSMTNLMAKFGNDPDFIAFTANIGKEMAEDTLISNGVANEQDFAVKTAELRQQLQDLPPHDPKRAQIQQQLTALYDAKFNKSASRTFTG